MAEKRKLTAYEIWKRNQINPISDEEYFNLLVDNGIIKKGSILPSEELITMLSSYVQDNRIDYAKEVFNLCKCELIGK